MNDKDEARRALVKRLRQSANSLASLGVVSQRRELEGAVIDLRQAANEIEDLAGIPSQRRTYTAIEVAAKFFSGDYDHLSPKEFREQFPVSRAELHRLFGAGR